MQRTALTFAAEFEQAATAAAMLDQLSAPGAPWGYDAITAVVERFGHAGEDLPFEYQNCLFEVEHLNRPAHFILFH
jgi:hypothetical protein